jgi:hypothetical protein
MFAKPRIRLLPEGSPLPFKWVCIGHSDYAYGRTPREAYEKLCYYQRLRDADMAQRHYR